MARIRHEESEAMGQDSFLDVITNIVGILIILVMVAGIRARNAPVTEAELKIQAKPAVKTQIAQSNDDQSKKSSDIAQRKKELEQEFTELKKSAGEYQGMVSNVQTMELQIKQLQNEWEGRKQNQSRLISMLAMTESQMQELRSKLTAQQQLDFDLHRQLTEVKTELQQLDQAANYVSNSKSPTVEIAHSTPLSKIVDGEEIHFQCRSGRVAYVPMNELVSLARKEFESIIKGVRSPTDLQDVVEREYRVGPTRGFEMRFYVQEFSDRRKQQHGLQLRRFDLFPEQSTIGELREEAMQSNSVFRDRMREFSPRQATITLWVYPDSFALYRNIEDELRKQGFSVAGRLMPAGAPIGGSPSGSKSLAQ